MKKLSPTRLAKLILMISALLAGAVAIYLCWSVLPDIFRLLKEGSIEDIQSYLAQSGRRGVVILVLLQVLQTVTIVFPGIPIYVASGLVYGHIRGTVLCYVTYVVSNTVIFLFSRYMSDAAEALFSRRKKKQAEGQEAAENMLQRAKHPAVIVAVLCVVPLIPNGIIPHIASKTKIRAKHFVAAIAIGCLPGIFLFVYCGALILDGYLVPIIVLCVIAIVCMIVFAVFKKPMMKFVNEKILSRFIKTDAEAENTSVLSDPAEKHTGAAPDGDATADQS